MGDRAGDRDPAGFSRSVTCAVAASATAIRPARSMCGASASTTPETRARQTDLRGRAGKAVTVAVAAFGVAWTPRGMERPKLDISGQ
ncbi:hypothetical protein [Streptomyces sp. AK02-01A]|uniref:hypothetical protein n=1 Tax=Streptomyces sp. AK02-01A TaxID=3028648 RepID=UPI0029CA889B|nr:hypothetical protein [Streptomyces sp. AK02-01A]